MCSPKLSWFISECLSFNPVMASKSHILVQQWKLYLEIKWRPFLWWDTKSINGGCICQISRESDSLGSRSISSNTRSSRKQWFQGEQKNKAPRKKQTRSFGDINFIIITHKYARFQSSSTPGSGRATIESRENRENSDFRASRKTKLPEKNRLAPLVTSILV